MFSSEFPFSYARLSVNVKLLQRWMADIYSPDPSQDRRGKMGENLILTGENGKQGPEVENIHAFQRDRSTKASAFGRGMEEKGAEKSLLAL
ncbi:hypothetical protein CEXT_382221 [Caerostris extrusa]|uniref:Uncharacterized protein n=1 Tax=Caerostris extrusa TaxID=172846 RepID=A0AAV4N6S7_CAEEX|nr:hypothetical protein CEXT_382221 [Caerostris extrusa]